jgi:hypothetical protein
MSRKPSRKSRGGSDAWAGLPPEVQAQWRARTRSLIAKLHAGTFVPLEITPDGEVEIGPAPPPADRLPAKLRSGEFTMKHDTGIGRVVVGPAPRRPTPEEHAMGLDMLIAWGGVVKKFGPDGKLVTLSTRPPPGRSWRELFVDVYNVQQPEEIHKFRQKWALRVTAQEFAEFRTTMLRAGVPLGPQQPSRIGRDLRARYGVRRVRWQGVAALYAFLLSQLGIQPARDAGAEPHPQAKKGTVILQQREERTGQASAAIAPVGAVCVYCGAAFLPRGTVRDCCPNPACRRARKNAQKRTWYAEHREQEVRRVMRAQRQARRARRA